MCVNPFCNFEMGSPSLPASRKLGTLSQYPDSSLSTLAALGRNFKEKELGSSGILEKHWHPLEDKGPLSSSFQLGIEYQEIHASWRRTKSKGDTEFLL